MPLLRQTVEQDLMLLDLEASNMDDILHAAVELTVREGKLEADDAEQVRDALLQRERVGSTAIGHAVAVPHAYLNCF